MSNTEIYSAILEAQTKAQPVMLATVLKTQGSVPRRAGAKMLVYPDRNIVGTIGGGEMENRVINQAVDIIKRKTPEIVQYNLNDPAAGDPGVCGGQVEIFLEPIMPAPSVFVIGCGHVGQAVADLAKWLGFYVIVSDDREELCSADIIPQADKHMIIKPEEIAQSITVHEQMYIAVVTRNAGLDILLLPGLLETPAAYIGVIGSRKRWLTTAEALQEQGVADETIQRIHTPIGIDIHAETPREIALSIMSEIISAHYKANDKEINTG